VEEKEGENKRERERGGEKKKKGGQREGRAKVIDS
jgi:hypothetical protein